MHRLVRLRIDFQCVDRLRVAERAAAQFAAVAHQQRQRRQILRRLNLHPLAAAQVATAAVNLRLGHEFDRLAAAGRPIVGRLRRLRHVRERGRWRRAGVPAITPTRKPFRPARGATAGAICVSSISCQTVSFSSGSSSGKRAQMISICTLSGDGRPAAAATALHDRLSSIEQPAAAGQATHGDSTAQRWSERFACRSARRRRSDARRSAAEE